MAKPKLSVIIPTLNRNIYLVNTIKQVLSDSFKDLELIVVDQSDNHDAETKQFLATLNDSRFHYFNVHPKSGVSAKNFGLTKALAQISVFLDDDVILEPDCLSRHYKAYQDDPELGGVAGRIKQDGLVQVQTVLYFDRWGSPHNTFNCPISQAATSMPGGNMSVLTQEALQIGGFDTTFLRSQHYEESEFSERYRRGGHRLVFLADASLKHLAAPYGGARIKVDWFDSADFYENYLYFILRFCRLRELIPALLVQYRRSALRKKPFVTIRRTALFTWGLVVAIKRLVLPKKIVAEEIVSQ
jgi:glycosyltransferase involved in cell wall biosynthesis